MTQFAHFFKSNKQVAITGLGKWLETGMGITVAAFMGYFSSAEDLEKFLDQEFNWMQQFMEFHEGFLVIKEICELPEEQRSTAAYLKDLVPEGVQEAAALASAEVRWMTQFQVNYS